MDDNPYKSPGTVSRPASGFMLADGDEAAEGEFGDVPFWRIATCWSLFFSGLIFAMLALLFISAVIVKATSRAPQDVWVPVVGAMTFTALAIACYWSAPRVLQESDG